VGNYRLEQVEVRRRNELKVEKQTARLLDDRPTLMDSMLERKT
jgi:hypothetical protein